MRAAVRAIVLVLLLAAAGCGREAPQPAGVSVVPAAGAVATPPTEIAETAPTPIAPRPVEAPPPPGAACLAGTVKEASPRARAVHRWVDAAGITHYSDQAPPRDAREHRLIDLRQPPPISVQASGFDANLPDELQRRAVADALGVQRVLRDALAVVPPPGIALRVVFVSDGEAYGRLIGNPSLAASAGAYSTAQRTIFVRRQERDEANFAVLRHEITHALVHESIGSLPTPINEGLAEYFGRYRAAGMGGQIEVGAGREAILAAAVSGDGGEALVDLLAREGGLLRAGRRRTGARAALPARVRADRGADARRARTRGADRAAGAAARRSVPHRRGGADSRRALSRRAFRTRHRLGRIPAQSAGRYPRLLIVGYRVQMRMGIIRTAPAQPVIRSAKIPSASASFDD